MQIALKKLENIEDSLFLLGLNKLLLENHALFFGYLQKKKLPHLS